MADVFTEKVEQENNEKLMLAWINAYWQRVEKLEPFETFIKKKEETAPKSMTTEEMLLKVYELNARMGGVTVGGE